MIIKTFIGKDKEFLIEMTSSLMWAKPNFRRA